MWGGANTYIVCVIVILFLSKLDLRSVYGIDRRLGSCTDSLIYATHTWVCQLAADLELSSGNLRDSLAVLVTSGMTLLDGDWWRGENLVVKLLDKSSPEVVTDNWLTDCQSDCLADHASVLMEFLCGEISEQLSVVGCHIIRRIKDVAVKDINERLAADELATLTIN